MYHWIQSHNILLGLLFGAVGAIAAVVALVYDPSDRQPHIETNIDNRDQSRVEIDNSRSASPLDRDTIAGLNQHNEPLLTQVDELTEDSQATLKPAQPNNETAGKDMQLPKSEITFTQKKIETLEDSQQLVARKCAHLSDDNRRILAQKDSCFEDAAGNYSANIKTISSTGIVFTNYEGRDISCLNTDRCSFGWPDAPEFSVARDSVKKVVLIVYTDIRK